MPPYFEEVGLDGEVDLVGTPVEGPSRGIGSSPAAVAKLVEELPPTQGTRLEEVSRGSGSSPRAVVNPVEGMPPTEAAWGTHVEEVSQCLGSSP